MKKEEIIVDNEKLEIVVQLPDEFKEENLFVDLEDTLDLEEVLQNTTKIELSGRNE